MAMNIAKTCAVVPYLPIIIMPLPVKSSIPTAHTREVSLITVVNWDTNGGIVFLKDWGKTIYSKV